MLDDFLLLGEKVLRLKLQLISCLHNVGQFV